MNKLGEGLEEMSDDLNAEGVARSLRLCEVKEAVSSLVARKSRSTTREAHDGVPLSAM